MSFVSKDIEDIWNRAELLFLFGFIHVYISAQEATYPIVRTPNDVAVNRTLPKGIIAPGSIMRARFSKEPPNEEMYTAHIFEEPLVSTSGIEVPGENAALVYALAAFSQRSSADDFSSITQFLNRNPDTHWRGALLANLGIIYRRSGYYNQAMNSWEEAWKILKGQTERKVKVLADRVASELLLINAWVGRQDRIEELLKEIDKRVIEGPAVERVSSMRAALWTMKNKPGLSFKCGPYALNKLYSLKDSTEAFNDKLMEVQSTSQGFSLLDLEKMSQDVGMDYQMAFRSPGAAVITNAVVHWKLNHYSALLQLESGHFKCQDATMGTVYGQEFWLSPAAIDSSASGYFLVPNGALPSGWRQVSASEGAQVFGKGQENPDNGKHVSNCDGQEPNCNNRSAMARANVHLLSVSLHIFDRPVYYTPPIGPAMIWDVDYHQRDSYQPANFSYSNIGPKWTFNWLSYVQDNPTNLSANADVYVMGGGVRTFTSFNTVTQSFAPELQTNDVLVRVCPTCYELRHPDGSKEVYARPDGSTASGRKIFLTQKVDAAGNMMTLSYDASLRVVALKDAIGQVTTIKYENTDIYKITKVIDPFGRSASFEYDGTGRMNRITDMIGIVSSFTYDAGDFINQMTTPYGTTSFIKDEPSANIRSLETHYPLGEKEKVEYRENADGINMSEAVAPTAITLTNTYLVYRNTFYWDKKAMKEAPGDFTQAKIYHWLHGSGSTNESGIAAPILESIKEPLESRVWFFHQNQSSSIVANQGMSSRPSQIGRVLDDGSTQLSQFFYNALGKDTASIDPIGRKFSYKYDANNIDLLEVRQSQKGANELLGSFTYNSQHLPLTSTDASGLTTNYSYNTAGQLTSIINARKEATNLYYNPNNYLDSIVAPIKGAKVSFTYDAYGRIRTVTDPEGYTITKDYDALDRPTLTTYPDGTYAQTAYDRLDPVHMRDRMGRWSHAIYDSLDRPNVMQDALGRITQLIWCSCGSLAEIIDPLKQVTTFARDIQGRLIAKRYADGKGTTYTYENTTSRVKEVTDAKGQKTQFSYYVDDNPKQKTYVNATIATPSVSFTYDSIYNRVKTMTDGTGTTTYSYKAVNSGLGSNMLAAIDGSLPSDVISYTYDSLERVSSRSINGVTSSVIYDALGRVTSATNALGNFIYNYVNQTDRLSSINLPNGQTTLFDYYDNGGDQRLKQIWNKAADGSNLSKFNYDFNGEGQITKWTQQAASNIPTVYELGYDLSDQLTSATQKNQSTSAIIKRYAYQYDKASNRTSEQIDNAITSALYNNLNQLTKQQDRGPMHFKGMLSKFASVVVKNQTTTDSAIATVDTSNFFEAFVKTVPGNNNMTITATDYSGNNNKSTNNYNISVNAGVNNTLAYDNNGNTLSATVPAVTYGWDAEDRLVKITQGANVSEFVYDGLSRRVAEKLNGAIIKRWLWCGTELCEERDASGATVIKRFFDGGEQINGVNYYFTKDHLASVREMVAADGVTVAARYDYDPYGRRTVLSGNDLSDIGFTGHYYHKASGLYLTLYRAYDANLGRWVNRDPIEEEGGINLYGYVLSNPTNLIDPVGQGWLSVVGNFALGVAVGAAVAVAVVVAAPLVASAGAAVLVAAGVSAATATTVAAATVTTSLFVAGTVGTITTGVHIYKSAKCGNWDEVAYSAGNIVGGVAVGVSGGGRAISEGLMGRPSAAPNTWSISKVLKYEWDMRYIPNLGPPGLNYWATAPTPFSGGYTATFTSGLQFYQDTVDLITDFVDDVKGLCSGN
jgi:RHS repeat-associated protein